MRLVFSFVVMIAFLGFSVADATAQTKTKGAEITFESEVIDYGTIKQDANGVRKFTFTNTGDEPLLITGAKGSCGCTVPTYPKEPILPGQTGTIEVKYDTHRLGGFTKTVTVTTNATTGGQKILTIKGVVEPKQ